LTNAANEYWTQLTNAENLAKALSPASLPRPEVSLIDVPDPFDFVDEPDSAVPLRGIIVRTDFIDDDKWAEFCETVLKSEQEGMADLLSSNMLPGSTIDAPNDKGDEDESSSEDNDEQDADAMAGDTSGKTIPTGLESDTFIFVDSSKWPSSTEGPPVPLRNASNIALLRLFNDIDIVPCLPLPQGGKRVKGSLGQSPSLRLVDWHGFHEVYSGRMIWVYDSRSNADGCVRLITQRPTKYGLATGNSWRAQAPFIWELQLNLSAGNMTIDFGGEDRFDSGERQRNFDELNV